MKIKPLNKDQIILALDRLTRFKYTETKYLRVFKDIIINNLIDPKYKKSDLEKMANSDLRMLAEKIINYSLENMGYNPGNDYKINEKLSNYENDIFNLDKNINELLKNKINYKTCLNLLDNENLPQNLLWLKSLEQDETENKYKFPVKKIVICEGITEEILLPEFAKLCDYDFDRNGVYIISAGGKNQVVKLFYELSQILKLPIFVLLDKDAKNNFEEIRPKLREKDKVHVLTSGEFEDTLPLTLIKRTLTYELKNISILDNPPQTQNTVEMLEEIFKTRGMHEFKKSEFANMIKNNLKSTTDVSEEIKSIIKEIMVDN